MSELQVAEVENNVLRRQLASCNDLGNEESGVLETLVNCIKCMESDISRVYLFCII